MSTSTLLHSLFKYKAWANKELFAALAELDTVEQAKALHAALRLLNHVFVVDLFAAHLIGEAHSYTAINTPETPTLEDLHVAVAETDRWYVEYVSTLQPERLTEPLSFVFTDGQHGCMTREEILAHVVNHGSYHRGAVGRIIMQFSDAPNRDIFTGYLHMSEPARRK